VPNATDSFRRIPAKGRKKAGKVLPEFRVRAASALKT
jgi:hypothetical protein